jgi:transposase
MATPETARAFCRRRSVELSTSEIPTHTVADVLGVTTSAICRWRRVGLPKASDYKSIGRPRKLTDEQLVKLSFLLSKGAVAHGWPNELGATRLPLSRLCI